MSNRWQWIRTLVFLLRQGTQAIVVNTLFGLLAPVSEEGQVAAPCADSGAHLSVRGLYGVEVDMCGRGWVLVGFGNGLSHA